METYQRYSPVSLDGPVAETELRDGWQVVLGYHYEGKGPFLTDLSHHTKWDIQDKNISKLRPLGMTIPEKPGQCNFQSGVLLNRMNNTQAALWHLSAESSPAMPQEFAFTDVTDGYALFGLTGKEAFFIMEKITALDLSRSQAGAWERDKPPFLIQGPVVHVPCQIVVLGETDDGYIGILIACSRGYGQSMAEAIFDAGAEWKLRPAGEKTFCKYWV